MSSELEKVGGREELESASMGLWKTLIAIGDGSSIGNYGPAIGIRS